MPGTAAASRATVGGGKQGAHIGLYPTPAYALDQGDGAQGVATEFEEVVVPADALTLEDLGEQGRQQDLGVALRRLVVLHRIGTGIRSGQRVAVELAVGL